MGFLEAVGFLTILPIPLRQAPLERGEGGTQGVLRQAVTYFPLVGVLLGAILALLDWAVRPAQVQDLRAAVLVISWMVLTRGLHLDGLADTADALLGGWNREQRLSIMRDSRLGTFGVLSLCAVLLLKFSLLGGLPSAWRTPTLLLTPMLARWALVQAIVCYPPARREGMGHLFRPRPRGALGQGYRGTMTLLLTSAVTLALSLALGGLRGVAVLGVVVVVALLFNGWVIRLVGGLTGDTYGALCELEEVCAMATIVALEAGGLL